MSKSVLTEGDVVRKPTWIFPDPIFVFLNNTSYDANNHSCWNASTESCTGENVTIADITASGPVLPPFALWQTILIAIGCGFCIILTVAGNVLVLLSFIVERAIRQPSNYFIASLAATDVVIGSISMPFFTVYVLMGEWTLGPMLCDLWLSVDHTVCLVSQYTVLLITIDRFCSVKIAARYRSWRTRTKVLIMITTTWIIPALLFFISIFGWEHFVGYRSTLPTECEVQFLRDPIFSTALIVTYYWVTLVVLIILYAGIYKTAYDMQKKSEAKHRKMQTLVALSAGGMAGMAGRTAGFGMSKTQSTLISQDKPSHQPSSIIQKQQLQPSQSLQLPLTTSNRSLIHPVSVTNSTGSRKPNLKGKKSMQITEKKGEDKSDRSSSPTFDSDEESSQYSCRRNTTVKLVPRIDPPPVPTRRIVTSDTLPKIPEKDPHSTSSSKVSPGSKEPVFRDFPPVVPPVPPRSNMSMTKRHGNNRKMSASEPPTDCKDKVSANKFHANSDSLVTEVETEPSSRNYPVTEVDTESSSRNYHVTKVDTESSSRNYPVTEVETESSSRNYPVTEVETESSSRNYPVTEVETESSSRNNPVTEVDTESSSRNYPVTEVDSESSSKNYSVVKSADEFPFPPLAASTPLTSYALSEKPIEPPDQFSDNFSEHSFSITWPDAFLNGPVAYDVITGLDTADLAYMDESSIIVRSPVMEDPPSSIWADALHGSPSSTLQDLTSSSLTPQPEPQQEDQCQPKEAEENCHTNNAVKEDEAINQDECNDESNFDSLQDSKEISNESRIDSITSPVSPTFFSSTSINSVINLKDVVLQEVDRATKTEDENKKDLEIEDSQKASGSLSSREATPNQKPITIADQQPITTTNQRLITTHNAASNKTTTSVARADSSSLIEGDRSTYEAGQPSDVQSSFERWSKRGLVKSIRSFKKKKKKDEGEKRHRSKSENRANKALRTISVILGAFVACWTPYHIIAIAEGWCKCTNMHLFMFTYFLCYANSPINPFCYALANQQFKKTFMRILRGDFHVT